MTYEEVYTEIAERARIPINANEQPRLLRYFNFALDGIENHAMWWFLDTDCEIQMVDGTRSYAFPTTDTWSHTGIYISEIKVASVRVNKKRFPMVPREWLDVRYPDWLSSSNTGSPLFATVAGGRQVVLDHVPDSDWIASLTGSSKMTFNAQRSITRATAANIASGVDLEIDGIPRSWHKIVVTGGLVGGWERQGSAMYSKKETEFRDQLDEMEDKCLPFDGARDWDQVSFPNGVTMDKY